MLRLNSEWRGNNKLVNRMYGVLRMGRHFAMILIGLYGEFLWLDLS